MGCHRGLWGVILGLFGCHRAPSGGPGGSCVNIVRLKYGEYCQAEIWESGELAKHVGRPDSIGPDDPAPDPHSFTRL